MKIIYDVQFVWNDINGKLSSVDEKLQWDREDPNSKPFWLATTGLKELRIDGLTEIQGENGKIRFIYPSPGFEPSKVKTP